LANEQELARQFLAAQEFIEGLKLGEEVWKILPIQGRGAGSQVAMKQAWPGLEGFQDETTGGFPTKKQPFAASAIVFFYQRDQFLFEEIKKTISALHGPVPPFFGGHIYANDY